MTTTVYVGQGLVFIDADKVPPSGRLKAHTRLSICLAGEYVAIMEVNLPDGVELLPGSQHTVPVRMLTDRELSTDIDYEIRNPINPIGQLRLSSLELEKPLR